MNLEDALSDQQNKGMSQWPSAPPSGQGMWPSAPASGPGVWPGAPSPGGNPSCPGMWPGAPTPGGNPSGPGMWPGAPTPGGNPSGPGMWPGAPTPGGNPSGPGMWPGAPTPGGNPSGPGMWPGAPSHGGNPSGPGMWPGGSGGHPAGPGWPNPSPCPAPGEQYPTAPQKTLRVPYSMDISGGIRDNLHICIEGTINPSANKITVDLQAGNYIAFHFNPRFNEGGKKVIVRNASMGKWGREERDLNGFPFHQGKKFEMVIKCTKTGYIVTVNGCHVPEFRHRITDLRSINKLCIHNDLTLSNVYCK